jgi:hypothetical protein
MFLVGCSFLLYPTLRYVNLYGFEYLRFSIPFLAWAFYPLYRRWTELYARMGGWRRRRRDARRRRDGWRSAEPLWS